MLGFLRKRASSWAIKFIFSLIIIVFVLWGVGSMREREQTVVGSIGKTKITTGEFQNTVNLITDSYKSMLGDRFDYKIFEDRIKNEAWDVLVEQTLLLRKADELKIKVSEEEVVDDLRKQEAFKENGQFSRDRYLNVLRYLKTSPAAYERQVERSLLMKKMSAILKNSVTVSDQDLHDFYRLKNKSIKVGYTTFSYKDFLKLAGFTEDEEKKYYQENKDLFKKPEAADISYVFLPVEDFSGGIKIEEADLKNYYDEHKEEFFVPKSYVLRHIFSAFGNDRAAAQKKIDGAKKLLAKESFAKVAGKLNDDGTKAKGGLIGEVTINMLTPKLSAKLLGMKKGEVSDIMESEYGYHILKVEDFKEERLRELGELKSELAAKIKENKAKLFTMKKGNEIKAAMEKGKEKDAAGKYGVKRVTVGKDNPVLGDLGAMPDIIKTIFAGGEGRIFGPLPVTKGLIVGKVNSLGKGYFSISESKGKIKEGLLKKKALELAAKKAEESLKNKAALKGGVTDWFSPVSQVPAPLNTVSGLSKDILGLSKKHPLLNKVYKGADNAYVIYLIDEKIKEWDLSSDDAKAFAAEFLSNKRNLFFSEWMKAEKESVKIKQNEDMFKKL